MASIPNTIEDITIRWLESKLQGSLFTSNIESLTYEPVAGGYTGLNYRISLATSDQAPLTLFVKFPIGESYNTKSADTMERYRAIARNEIRFYREIAPEVQTPTPKCWFSAYDDDNSLLILEDLGNGRLPGNRTDLSDTQIAQIAASMADFHRHFWESEQLEGMDWISTRFAGERNHAEEIRSFQRAAGVFVERFKAHLTDGQLRLIDKIAADYPRLKSAVASPPLTLTHGDWTTVNVMWREADNKAYVFDWAGISVGTYVWDMIKFLDFELDQRVLDVFLNTYAKSLNRDGTLVAFDELCQRFYLAQAWYLCGTIEFIVSIKEEHLRDAGTEWIWDFANNREIYAHLADKLV